MIARQKILPYAVALASAALTTAALGDQQPPQPDNSKVNKQVTENAAATAESQGSDPQSIDNTRKIRKAITEDKSLSTYAHNIKIISNGNDIVLKGPVRTADEKQAIEAIATRVVPTAVVKNQISVAP